MKNSGARKIAERYVKALLDVAGSARDAIENDLNGLEAALAQSTEFREFLRNPLLTREQRSAAMDAILAKMKADKITVQFVNMLAAQKRLELLPEIIALYRDKVQGLRGEISAQLVSAAPMNEKETAEVADSLSKAYGKKIHLSVKQDASLIGGAVIKIGSVQLDSSLAGKLDRLKLALKAA